MAKPIHDFLHSSHAREKTSDDFPQASYAAASELPVTGLWLPEVRALVNQIWVNLKRGNQHSIKNPESSIQNPSSIQKQKETTFRQSLYIICLRFA